MTFAEKLRTALKAQGLPALPSEERTAKWDEVVNATAHAEGIARQKKPKGVARARNPLFDALALAGGCRDLNQLTRLAAKAVGVALADIMAVTPDLTPDEIYRRRDAYKRRWPDPRNLSAMALAKHWDEFALVSTEAKTRARLHDPYQLPVGDWFQAAAKKFGYSSAEAMREKGWFEFGIDHRLAILKEMHK